MFGTMTSTWFPPLHCIYKRLSMCKPISLSWSDHRRRLRTDRISEIKNKFINGYKQSKSMNLILTTEILKHCQSIYNQVLKSFKKKIISLKLTELMTKQFSSFARNTVHSQSREYRIRPSYRREGRKLWACQETEPNNGKQWGPCRPVSSRFLFHRGFWSIDEHEYRD